MNVIPRSRGVKRSRGAPRPRAVARRVPRSLRYNGQTAFTRTTSTALVLSPTGFVIGAGNFPAIALVFDPTAMTLFGSALTFTSSALPNAAEIAAFWDLVAIDKVELTFTATFDPSAVTTANLVPRLIVANDYNSGGTGTTLDAIYEHSDCKSLDGMITKWSVKPKYQRVIFYNAVTSSYEPGSGFINADTAIPHYGTLLGIRDFASLTSGRLLITAKYFMRAKNTK